MTMNSDWRVTGLGVLVLLGAACGDDANSGITASVGETSITGNTEGPGNTSNVSSNSDGETSPTTSTTAGSNSDSDSSTGEPATTTDPGTTSGPDTTSDPGTSTDPGTTTDDGSTTTGGVDTTTGETTNNTTNNTTGDTGDQVCPLAQMHMPCDAASDDALHAIGLNCTTLGGQWVDNQTAVAVTNLSFQAAPPSQGKRAWQVAKAYGSFVDPNTNQPFWNSREGDKVLLISSGLLPPPNPQGAVIVANGDVYNDVAVGGVWDSNVMPPPMSPNPGSPDPMGYTNCDGTNDCSNTIFDQWNLGTGDPEDKMWFSFDVTAPAIANGQIADAKGYTFDFAYFSAEFPEWVGDEFNDIFVVWQSSEDYTGNVTFINGQPLTVTALWPIDYQTGDVHLQGTGHINDGGATGWYKATSGVKPGETFTLAFAIFDMGDSTYDTTAIIDNWSWDCEGCVPNEVDDCGIQPQ